ncbi:MAG: FliH/SctL family protein [Planctomycetaceae bacterium]
MQGRKQTIGTGPTRHIVRVTQPVRSARLVGSAVVPRPAVPVPVGPRHAQASQSVPDPSAAQTRQPRPAPTPAHDPAVLQVIETRLNAIEAAVQETELRRQESLDELRLVTVEMSVAIASRIVGDSAQSTTGIEELVNEAVTRFGGSDEITIALNPNDLAELNRALEGRPPPWSESGSPRLVADRNVASGDCEVNGTDFNYVARMELVLDEIRVGLMESLEHAQIERRRTQATGSGLRRFPDRRETA